MMEVPSSLEYLCRVCAANTKGKNSVAECVYIFKNTDLKQKIEKHLFLKICENDALPKILCKTCYRKVEDIAALTNIAKHTHEVFNDYLISNSAKALASDTGVQYDPTKQDVNNSNDKSIEKLYINNYKMPTTAPPPMVYLPGVTLSSVTNPPPPPLTKSKTDVALNSTHLNRENQEKAGNSQRKQSIILDSKYTPKSIAQKSLNLTIPQQKKDIVITANLNNKKNHSPPGVINFFPTITKQPLVNTLAGGNYLMSRLNSVADKDAYRKSKSPSQQKNLNSSANITNSNRKSASRSISSDKNTNLQISLLKAFSEKAEVSVPYTTESKSSITENLSNKLAATITPILCNSPETNKLPPTISSPSVAAFTATTTATAETNLKEAPIRQLPKALFPDEILLGKVIKDVDLLKLILKALKWTVSKETLDVQIQRLRNSKFTEIMSDPNLLQDTDLTQLLGPYLAPVLQAAYAFQQQQQLLNILQAQSTAQTTTTERKPIQLTANDINSAIPYKLPPETSVQLVPASPEQTDINKALLSETLPSIPPFLVIKKKTTVPNVLNAISAQSKTGTPSKSKPYQIYREGEQHEMHQLLSNTTQNLDYTQQCKTSQKLAYNGNMIPSAEALIAFLKKQKNMPRRQRRLDKRRNTNFITLPTGPSNKCETSINIDDDDDIVLLEESNCSKSNSNGSTKINTTEKPTTSQNNECIDNTPQLELSSNNQTANTAVAASVTVTSTTATATLPAPKTATTVIYKRPIVKRRKTVIQTTMREKSIICENILQKFGHQIQQMEKVTNVDETKTTQVPLRPVAISTQISEQSATNAGHEGQSVMKPLATDETVKAGCTSMYTETDFTDAGIAKLRKQSNSKAALGQHLLEAVGLQKVMGKKETVTDAEVSSSNNDKDSVQQIRYVLKRSLKQAQDDQHRKLESSLMNTTNETLSHNKGTESESNSNIEDNQGKFITNNSKQDNDCSKSSIVRTPQKRLTAFNDRTRNKCANAEESNEHEMQKRYDVESTGNLSEDLEGNLVTNTNSMQATEVIMEHTEPEPARRRGRKSNAEKFGQPLGSNTKSKYQKLNQTIKIKATIHHNDSSESTSLDISSRRPTRHSKTLSKYYKGPDKTEFTLRSLPSRITRNKKNS